MSLCHPPFGVVAPSPGDALPWVWSFIQQAQVGVHRRRCAPRFAPPADLASPRHAVLASQSLAAAVSAPDDAPRRPKSFLEKTLIRAKSPRFAPHAGATSRSPLPAGGAIESPVSAPDQPQSTGLSSLDLGGLNDQQRAAIDHVHGPLLVFAGAGSGKTRVITCRVANLIAAGVAPWNILAVTFTNKAANEMRERIVQLVGRVAGGVHVGTFHGQALRILRRDIHNLGREPDFSIYDADDQLRMVKQAMSDVGIGLTTISPVAIRNAISRAKDELADPYVYAERSEGYFEEAVAQIYHRYQRLLDSANGVDFGDMIAFCVRLFREFPELRAFYQDRFRFILVDEYQDTNRAQYEFVRQLGAGRGNVCVVGDDDQSIYTWRGADIRNILDFEGQFPATRVIRLERNYRSTGNILESANAVISKVATRAEKTLWTEREDGEPPAIIEAFDEEDEARQVGNLIRELRGEGIPRQDIAIIYRTNAQSRPLEEWFVRQGLPYQLVGATEFYGRREVRDALAYLRAVANPRDLVSFERIANTPRRGIGAKTLQVLREWAERSSRSSGEMTRLLAADADSGEPVHSTLDNPFATRATRALTELGRLLRRLDTLADELPVGALVNAVVRESGYDDVLDNDPDRPEERWENVVELQTAASKYDGLGPRESLRRYLSEAALVSDVDSLTTDSDAVTLLTAHSAKGLEFGVVILVGLEEELFPHVRSYDEPAQMDEERRLAYVAFTRAKDRLFLTYTRHRSGWGAPVRFPSRFLQDIPPERLTYRRRLDARPSILTSGFGATDEEAQPKPPTERTYHDGQRVRHPVFGEGLIVAGQITNFDEEVTVMFAGDVGLKKLAVSYAKLEAVS